jgi:hypothetical protein
MKMPDVFNDLLASKKFTFTLLTSVLAVLAWKMGWTEAHETKLLLTTLWPVYLASQGVADVGDKLAKGRVIESAAHEATQKEKNAEMRTLIEGVLKVYAEFADRYYTKNAAGVTEAPILVPEPPASSVRTQPEKKEP